MASDRLNRIVSRILRGSGLAFCICILGMPLPLRAQMNEIAETELANVSAQAGITFVIGDSQLRITAGTYSFSDTDHDPLNWLELNNVTVDDGSGGYFSLDTPWQDPSDPLYNFNTIDLATLDGGQTFLWMNLSTMVQPRTYSVGNLVFCLEDLGGLRVENLRSGISNRLLMGGRQTGSGIDMEYDTEYHIDNLKYLYNDMSETLALGGIHLVGSVDGDPASPASWTPAGKFKFGDIENGRPVTMDVGYSAVEDTSSVFYNLPMSGSLRIENVNFSSNANSFGPCAIDGINVHHLGIRIGTN